MAPKDVATFVRRLYFDGIPFELAAQYDSDSLPKLKAILNDAADKEYWANVVGVMGAIGGEKVSQTLIDFIEAQDNKSLDTATFRASLSAMIGLGYAANKNGPEALSYLSATTLKLRTAEEVELPAHLQLNEAVERLGTVQQKGIRALRHDKK